VILLDTNVISALMREPQDQAVIRWLDLQPRASIWTTSVNVFESRLGLQVLPVGKRRQSMLAVLDRVLSHTIEGRIVAFDTSAAQYAASLAAARQNAGRPKDHRDTMIAGIVLANHATFATRNVRHFEDISASVVNPWVA